MNILIFGSGVIGSTYGGLIAKAGCNVTLYARNKRFAELCERGLLIQKIGHNEPERVPVKVISELKPDNYYDFVFVTIRKDQVNESLSEIAQINSNNIVFMINNPSGYSEWVNAIGFEKVIPAFPGAGGKIEDGVVYYELVNKFIQPTTIGELSGKITPRIQELKALLSKSKFHVSISVNMDSWQKTHVAMVAPMGNVIYLDGGNNYSVSKNREAIRQMNLALRENFNFLHKSGIGIEPNKLVFFRFCPLWLLNILMKYVYNTKWAETVICNHALNAKQEMRVISKEFFELAKSKGFNLKEFEKLIHF